jgi:hypothetical protein
VAVPDQFENALALAREPQAALPTYSPGILQCLFDTGIVIVLRIVGWTGWLKYGHAASWFALARDCTRISATLLPRIVGQRRRFLYNSAGL